MCNLIYCICSKCYAGHPKFFEPCNFPSPSPLHTVGHKGIQFKFRAIPEEECHLHPYHLLPLSHLPISSTVDMRPGVPQEDVFELSRSSISSRVPNDFPKSVVQDENLGYLDSRIRAADPDTQPAAWSGQTNGSQLNLDRFTSGGTCSYKRVTDPTIRHNKMGKDNKRNNHARGSTFHGTYRQFGYYHYKDRERAPSDLEHRVYNGPQSQHQPYQAPVMPSIPGGPFGPSHVPVYNPNQYFGPGAAQSNFWPAYYPPPSVARVAPYEDESRRMFGPRIPQRRNSVHQLQPWEGWAFNERGRSAEIARGRFSGEGKSTDAEAGPSVISSSIPQTVIKKGGYTQARRHGLSMSHIQQLPERSLSPADEKDPELVIGRTRQRAYSMDPCSSRQVTAPEESCDQSCDTDEPSVHSSSHGEDSQQKPTTLSEDEENASQASQNTVLIRRPRDRTTTHEQPETDIDLVDTYNARTDQTESQVSPNDEINKRDQEPKSQQIPSEPPTVSSKETRTDADTPGSETQGLAEEADTAHRPQGAGRGQSLAQSWRVSPYSDAVDRSAKLDTPVKPDDGSDKGELLKAPDTQSPSTAPTAITAAQKPKSSLNPLAKTWSSVVSRRHAASESLERASEQAASVSSPLAAASAAPQKPIAEGSNTQCGEVINATSAPSQAAPARRTWASLLREQPKPLKQKPKADESNRRNQPAPPPKSPESLPSEPKHPLETPKSTWEAQYPSLSNPTGEAKNADTASVMSDDSMAITEVSVPSYAGEAWSAPFARRVRRAVSSVSNKSAASATATAPLPKKPAGTAAAAASGSGGGGAKPQLVAKPLLWSQVLKRPPPKKEEEEEEPAKKPEPSSASLQQDEKSRPDLGAGGSNRW
ncbi:hypothetical protein F4777DRAFT_567675 [Nemania sp. FL0916]|nr:hypothetical protein F4777DRAFT_567675 [Nemania sp. FL0916]